jgi:hypothetical protein
VFDDRRELASAAVRRDIAAGVDLHASISAAARVFGVERVAICASLMRSRVSAGAASEPGRAYSLPRRA